MNEIAIDYANNLGVSIEDLHKKICDGLAGVSISHFTDDELKMLKAALEIAVEW